MIMCGQPSRTEITNNPWVTIPPLPDLIRMHEMVMAPLRPSPVIALSMNTFDLSDEEARAAIERVSRETGLPATDPVRFDPVAVVDAIVAFHGARVSEGVAAA
jgi:uncharacterized NAD-dependent epimerase/dehydratase family protein